MFTVPFYSNRPKELLALMRFPQFGMPGHYVCSTIATGATEVLIPLLLSRVLLNILLLFFFFPCTILIPNPVAAGPRSL